MATKPVPATASPPAVPRPGPSLPAPARLPGEQSPACPSAASGSCSRPGSDYQVAFFLPRCWSYSVKTFEVFEPWITFVRVLKGGWVLLLRNNFALRVYCTLCSLKTAM